MIKLTNPLEDIASLASMFGHAVVLQPRGVIGTLEAFDLGDSTLRTEPIVKISGDWYPYNPEEAILESL